MFKVYEKNNIDLVLKALSQNPDNISFNRITLQTHIEGWNNASSINYHWTGTDELTYAEYISRLTGKV
jgi:hypothetical protein